MSDRSVTLHRVIKASPEKVYRAFTDSTAYSWWIPPYGFLGVMQQWDFKAGGRFKMSFLNFSTGKGQSFGGTFLEIKPNEFIKYSNRFDDPNLKGELVTSVYLNKVFIGTELKVLQEGIPTAIPLEYCYLGWQESLDKLIRLVEPEIPDA